MEWNSREPFYWMISVLPNPPRKGERVAKRSEQVQKAIRTGDDVVRRNRRSMTEGMATAEERRGRIVVP